MKKTSIGVRGMKLAEGDKLDHAYLLEKPPGIYHYLP